MQHSLVAVATQKSLPILEMYSGDALLVGGDLLFEKEIEETMLELFKPFADGMQDEEMESFPMSAKKVGGDSNAEAPLLTSPRLSMLTQILPPAGPLRSDNKNNDLVAKADSLVKDKNAETKHHQDMSDRFQNERTTKLVHPLPKRIRIAKQNEEKYESKMQDKASEESGQHLASDESWRLSRQITNSEPGMQVENGHRHDMILQDEHTNWIQ